MTGLIVIGYDGSDDADHAIAVGASILGVTDAVVVHVWRPAVSALPTAPTAGGAPPPFEEDDAALEAASRRTAGQGVERAAEAGFRARAETRRGAAADVGRILATMADQYDAELVLVGRRGVSRLEAVVLGSVSNDTVRESRRPVLVVPSPRP